MIEANLCDVYRDYIACLNKQDWPKLEQFVHDEAYYNGQRIGILGYREMLERDFSEIPDLHSAPDFRSASYSEPARVQLYAKGKVPGPPCKREEGFLYRECIL
jgi:predicted ester cyclase